MIDVTLPLIDLHRHLEGSVRIETIMDLGRRYDLPLPASEVDDLRPYVQVMDIQPGMMAFIEKFKWAVGVLLDYDACGQISYESVEDALNEGIDYVELRFSLCFMAKPHGLEPLAVVESNVDGVIAAKRDTGMKANLIGIISRTYGPEQAWNELEALLSFKDQLVAVDLAGDEMNFPGEMFIEHVQKARDPGLSVTIHAGESAGPQSVWQAILDLGAKLAGSCCLCHW